MKKGIKRVLAFILALAMCVSTTGVAAYAEETVVADKVTAECGWDGVTTVNNYTGENFNVVFSLANYWEGGYNANVKVENTGSSVIENWYLSFALDNRFSSIWNAEVVSSENGQYVVKNANWNADIPVGGCVEFGISVNETFAGFPKEYKLLGESTQVQEEAYSVEYILDNDWGTGFTARMLLTNHTETALEDWTLEFDFDREITSIWNGVIEAHEGNHYVIKNAGHNANVVSGSAISFGFNGEGGTAEDVPENAELYEYNVSGEYAVTFVVGAEEVTNIPEEQSVERGTYVEKPENPEREGYLFMGWYLDKSFTKQFDFEATAVNRNLTLYARWLDYTCTTDTDSDGIVDSLEEYIGSDVNGTDTDGDGLTDYEELYEIGTNPLVKDTDGNGVEDFVDDLDEDGLSNGEEIRYNTNACHDDTDIDDLTDYDEINIYHTDPTLNDTDGDGAPDGWEIANGYDPLVHDNRYTLTESSGTISEANPVVAKVTVDAYDADVYSLEIRKVKYHDNPFISPFIAGYLGDAYEFTFDGKFDTAEMVFEYDVNLGELSDTFQPRIYYFNEETNAFEELENQTVENGRVTVTTTHFSTYILLNKVEFDEVWNTEIKTAADGAGLNIAFVVDLSGSMYGTKLTTTKTAINSFIDVLDDTDKAALISFTNDAVLRCDMTNDKEVLKSAVNGMRADGLTSIYRGIGKAMDVFETSDLNGYKMMVVFTDGYDEPSTTYEGYYKTLVERAGKAGVTIYSVGIITIDEALLTRVAESTGGKYYYASVVSELKEKVEEVKEEIIDYNSDSNDDGITDYHTKLIMEGKLLLKNSSDELKGIDFNYDKGGEVGGIISDDWDEDGIKNGDEIKVVSLGAWTYIEMKSHPLRQHSDSDGVDDYAEVQRGSDPLYYDVQKAVVDILCDESRYSFEPLAADLREDGFTKGLIGWSAIVNGVWNKKELYRDLLIDYYSTYVTQDVVDEATLQEEKETWVDVLVKMLEKANDELDKAKKVSEATEDYREAYDRVKNINDFISYANGITDAKMMDANFVKKITDELMHLNEVSEDATEFRFDVDGMPYIKKYWDEDFVKK